MSQRAPVGRQDTDGSSGGLRIRARSNLRGGGRAESNSKANKFSLNALDESSIDLDRRISVGIPQTDRHLNTNKIPLRK